MVTVARVVFCHDNLGICAGEGKAKFTLTRLVIQSGSVTGGVHAKLTGAVV